jgi:hypothetical protein
MAKTFRSYLPEQDLLLPPSLRDWLPENHLAYFVSDVVDQLDLSRARLPAVPPTRPAEGARRMGPDLRPPQYPQAPSHLLWIAAHPGAKPQGTGTISRSENLGHFSRTPKFSDRLLAGAFAALRHGRESMAGMLLAFATLKPQLSLPFIVWLTVWALSGEARRRHTAIFFGFTVAVLLAYSQALMPRWTVDFIRSLRPYLQYTNATSGLYALLGVVVGTIITSLAGAGVAIFCWRNRRAAATSSEFLLCSVLVLAFTALAIPSLAPHTEVVLIPACFLIWQLRKTAFGGRTSRPLWLGACLVVVWPWLSAAALIGAATLFQIDGSIWNAPLATNPIIPIIVFAALLRVATEPAAAPLGFSG